MARLISRQSGNFTTASTWGLVAAEQATMAFSAALATSYALSSQFTLANGTVVDGIAVYVSRISTAAGTMTLGLSADGGSTWAREVTINVSDIPPTTFHSAIQGWVFFEFGSTITGDGGTDYVVGLKTSIGSQITAHRSGTASDWARLVRSTTQQAPVAGDTLHVLGSHSGTGANNTHTVDVNTTNAVSYGAIDIGVRGTLQFPTTASVNTVLRVAGDVFVRNGGILNMGIVGTPIPSTSTAVLEFDCASDGQYGLHCLGGGTVIAQGITKTRKTELTADVAAAGTVLTVADTTGWVAGDELGIAATTTTYTTTETGTIQSVDSATQVTLTAGLTNAHGGTGDVVAEVINLTSNVKIRSVSTTAMAYFYMNNGATVNVDHVEFRYMGENVATKRGINVSTIIVDFTVSIRYSIMRDFEDYGVYIEGSSPGTIEVSDNVLYACNNAATANTGSFVITTNTYTNLTADNNTLLRCLAGSLYGNFDIRVSGKTFTGNIVAGCAGLGFNYNLSSIILSLVNCVAHSNSSSGFQNANSFANLTFIGCKSWRNTGSGFGTASSVVRTNYNGCLMFGNSLNIGGSANVAFGHIIIRDSVLRGDASFATTHGILIGGQHGVSIYIYNSTFGVGVAHSTADIATSTWPTVIYAYDTIFASTTEWAFQGYSSVVRSQNHDQIASYHKHWNNYGFIESETTVRHTNSGLAWRLDPNVNAANAAAFDVRLRFPGPTENEGFPVQVVSGELVTIRVWLRKSSDYAGNAPRLRLIGGIVPGIAADVVDTMTVGADTWEELEVTATPTSDGVVEWSVECDGTTGYVYVDDATIV